ncbi:MAG: peptidoglycan-associated lipoprotein Pal [Alphaproteobacteria bacterium]|nr:peptidoglycan-associated lipoprotein Pal [Alphaproteobacteria bacterium]MBV9694658.1 peptidoglycan-associated lipoprotein Pal [Alphaproteobacteria bacterium]
MTKFSHALKLAGLCAALALAGCETKPPAAGSAPPAEPQQQSAPVQSSNIVPGSAEDLRVNVGDTVHFDYDKYDILDSDRATLQRQATWFAKYPSVRVTIEGHCDERGTREFNLALGARRANAVKEYLVSLGVAAGRLETISYGKERPICTESNESCWAQNRRGVTTISGGAVSS